MKNKKEIINRRFAIRFVSFVILFMIFILCALALTGCTEAERVRENLSQEADNFKQLNKK